MDEQVFLDKIKQQVLKEDENASVILFGSRARGNFQEDSDWDILVLMSKEVDFQTKTKIWDSIYIVELEFTQAVSTIIYNKKQWNSMSVMPLYQNVAEEGKRL